MEFDGDEETPSPNASTAMTKYFAGSTSSFAATKPARLCAGAGEIGREDHGIRAIGVELTPGAVAQLAAGDLLPVFQLAGAQIGELLLTVWRGLLRPAGREDREGEPASARRNRKACFRMTESLHRGRPLGFQ